MTIVDQHGKAFPEKDLSAPQTSDRTRYGHLPSTFEAVKSLTPAKIAQFFKAAEEGDLAAQHNFFSEMEEKDAHLFSDLAKRRRAVLAVEWMVKPPDDATPAEKKAAEAATGMLTNFGDFEDLCYDLLDAIGHGFSNIELSWKRTAKEWRIAEFNARPHSWFTLDEETRSKFLLKVQTGEPQPLQPFGWVSHVHKSKTGYVARAGLFRVLAWPYMFKHFSVGDWAEFLETYGMPVRVGKYPVGSTSEEKKTLFNAVMALGRNASAVMPDTMNVDFMSAAGSARNAHDPFLAMADWADKAMSKAILGGTLTTQADGKSSTNALGTVHNEVRQELVKSDAKQLQGTLTRDLIYPWLMLNGYNIDFDRCPRFVFDLVDTADVTIWAGALDKLVDAGMNKIPVGWVHKELGIPMAAEGEEVLQRTPVQNEVQKTTQTAQYAYRVAQKAMLKFNKKEDDSPLAVLIGSAFPDMEPAVQALLEPLVEAFSGGEPIDNVADELLKAQPQMETEQLTALLTQVFFVADLWSQACFNKVNNV